MEENSSVFENRFSIRKDLNQYWYSPQTINIIVRECETQATKIGFLSTPSVYFSLKNPDVIKNSRCFEYDRKFDLGDGGFVFYDFQKPENLPIEYKNSFDMLVIDPPFVT